MYIPICRPLKKPSNEALRKGGGGGAPWLLATSPATNNKYPATWNLSDNPGHVNNNNNNNNNNK